MDKRRLVEKRVGVWTILALFVVGITLLAPRVSAAQTSDMNANIDVKASGSGAHCTATAFDTYVYGVTSGEQVTLRVPIKLDAPGWADTAYGRVFMAYQGYGYGADRSEGVFYQGYLQFTVTAYPDTYGYFFVASSGNDGIWWSCSQQSVDRVVAFRA